MAQEIWKEKARKKEVNISIEFIAVMGLLIAFGGGLALIFFVTTSRANDFFDRCPKCGGLLGQCFLNGDDREDLVICDKCESIFVMDEDGLTDVFGIPPTIEGGNHEQRRTD